MAKKLMFTKINDLLDVCRDCPKNKSGVTPEIKCKGCQTYAEIRRLGDQLKKQERVIELEMTVDEYKTLRKTLKTDTKICLEKKIDRNELKEWKKQHAEELLDIPMSGPKIGNKPSPNAKVSKKMSDKLKAANAEIAKLKDKLSSKQNAVPASSKTDAEYKAMKDKLLANIDRLTEELEKATAEVKEKQAQVDSIAESNRLFEKALNDSQSDIEKNDQLESEMTQLKERADMATEEMKEAKIDAGKLVAENNVLKQQLGYAEQDRDMYYRNYSESKRQLQTLQAFVLEKLKSEVIKEAVL